MVTITIWDADGNIVVQEQCEAQIATDEQIADMVSLIEGGCPAHLASYLALTSGMRSND
jgi:hypothetical protein